MAAQVDTATDALIQRTIRTAFRQCTVLTIAHRLDTIADYDRVMVLAAGRVAEFDEPTRLMQVRTVFLPCKIADSHCRVNHVQEAYNGADRCKLRGGSRVSIRSLLRNGSDCRSWCRRWLRVGTRVDESALSRGPQNAGRMTLAP